MRSLLIDKNGLRVNLNEIRARAGSADIVADLSGDGQGVERARTILHLRTVPLFFGPAEEYADSEIGRTFMEGRD